MPLVSDYSRAQLAFQVEGIAIDEFLVIRFRGTEGLSQLYRFEIDLSCTDPAVDLEQLVGKRAQLIVETPDGPRHFHGIISRFELTDETVDRSFYRAEMVPMAWLMTHRYSCRIFQNLSVPDILTEVLKQAGISGDNVRVGPFQGKHEAREYCVQYRETDFNFICRLMEEEGIWYYFEQAEDSHVMVLADSTSSYKPIPGEAQLLYKAPTGLNIEEEHVFRFRRSHSVRPGAVVLREYNFENPSLDLQVKTAGDHDKGLEYSDYPGEYTKQAAGTDLATLRLQEFECQRVLAIGQSNSHRLTPARTFELAEHPSTALNGSYLVTQVMHQGKQSATGTTSGANGRGGPLDARIHQSLVAARQHENTTIRELADGLLQIAARLRRGDMTAHRTLTDWVCHAGQVSRDLAVIAGALGANPSAALSIANLLEDPSGQSSVNEDASVYECRFECIPSAVTYRAPRVTPWPIVRGSQTARVVGPSGEEIHTDKYARVKVQFNWDRQGKFDDKSSCWIRVCQGMAGGQYGMMFIPRVGQEVVVDFLEGNPDLPIITGRVYNADNMPPYTLPDEKTKSVIETRTTPGGEGFNELRFEDKKDNEQIFLHGQKDLDIRIKNDEKDWIGKNKHEIIKGSQAKSIGGAEGRSVGGDQAIKVSGSHSHQIKGDSYIVADGNALLGAKGDLALRGEKALLFGKSYTEVYAPTIIVKGDEITLTSGGNFIKIDGSGVTIVGGQVNINSGGGPGSSQGLTYAAAIEPAGPKEAATGDPGKDFTYAQEQPPPDALEQAPLHHEEESTEEEKHWIGVILYDDNGEPLPGEKYIIKLPDGTHVAKGRTDKEGKVEVKGIDPGSCEIMFPDLDGLTWAPGPAAGGAGGGGAGGGGAGPSAPSAPGGVSVPGLG